LSARQRVVIGAAALLAAGLVLGSVAAVVRERRLEAERVAATRALVVSLRDLLIEINRASPLPLAEGSDALSKALEATSWRPDPTAPEVQVIGVSGFHHVDPEIFRAIEERRPVRDAWGQPLRYVNAPTRGENVFRLWSAGPNRVDEDGRGDDIRAWGPP
jgi:hypothetical protein